MAQIFEGSFLTIAAAASKDDMGSLFCKDNIHSSSLKSHTGWTNDRSPYIIYSRIPFNYHPTDKSSMPYTRKNCTLVTRAWTYQERLLAPRILYFGEELTWECRERSACECSGAKRGTKYSHSLSLLPGCSSKKLHLQWQEMVEEFAWLQLSHEEDRLPALSGLAQQYQRRLKSEYLAGLWRENLVADLMWYAYPDFRTDAPQYSTQKPKKWRAPSWSWASLEGPIRFSKVCPMAKLEASTTDAISWVEIIAAECLASSLDPTGLVKKGQLIMKGHGPPARLRHREKCAGHETRHFTVKQTDINSFNIFPNFTVDGQQAYMEEAYVDYDLIEHGLVEPNSDMSIYRLYIAGMSDTKRAFDRKQGNYVWEPVYRTWSLLLQGIDMEKFERVGFVVSEHSNTGDQLRDGLHECKITLV